MTFLDGNALNVLETHFGANKVMAVVTVLEETHIRSSRTSTGIRLTL